MKIIRYILLIFVLILLTSCNFSNTTLTNDLANENELSNEELYYLLGNTSRINWAPVSFNNIIDSLINDNNDYSFYLFEIGVAQYAICLYIDSNYQYDDIFYEDYLDNIDKCKWICYDSIDQIVESINDQKLMRVFLAHETTIIRNLFSHRMINTKQIYYEDYTKCFKKNEETNLRLGYYLLYSQDNTMKLQVYTNNIELMTDLGYIHDVVKEENNYYLILLKQIVTEGEVFDILKYSMGEYYEILEPYIDNEEIKQIDQESYTVKARINIYDLIETVNGMKQ